MQGRSAVGSRRCGISVAALRGGSGASEAAIQSRLRSTVSQPRLLSVCQLWQFAIVWIEYLTGARVATENTMFRRSVCILLVVVVLSGCGTDPAKEEAEKMQEAKNVASMQIGL